MAVVYWLVASDGGVFSYGDAPFFGSAGAIHPQTKPIVGMAATPTVVATGWWPPTAGSSPTGQPPSMASTGAITLNQPIVGMAHFPDRFGY